MNNKIEKQTLNKSNDYNQYKKDLSSYFKSIKNILEKKSSSLNLKSINKEIYQIINNINCLFEKLINDKENANYKNYESILKGDENTIRRLYGDLLHEKLLKEILEEKIVLLLQTQAEYELVKDKTGVIVCDGKVICNERKDNEIIILRTENSTLKNVIAEKEKEISILNDKIKILNKEIIRLKRNKTNINININDINNPNSISKKNNKFITISRSREKQILFNTIYSPGYSSQKEITINNFSSSTKNFYKSYHMNTKIINNNINTNINKSIDKSADKSIEKANKNINININNQNSTIYPSNKLISVNKSKYNKKNSRNKKIYNNKYSSCENILNDNINKSNIKLNKNNNKNSKNNTNTNLIIKKSNEKKISKKKLFSPLQEFNSVKYINTYSINNYKEQNIAGIPKSTRDSNLLNHNIVKQNTNVNIIISSKFNNSNKKKNDEKIVKNIKGQKNGILKNKNIPLFRNDTGTKDKYNILFQRTYNENFRNDNNKTKNTK